jgi:transposase InsO family protein
MIYPFIAAHEGEFEIKIMCRVLATSVSGYYAWRQRRPSRRMQENQALLAQIQQVHQQSRQTYGNRRVTAALRAQGVSCNRKRIARLMRTQGLRGCDRRKRRPVTTQSNHQQPIVPNHLARNFHASQPNQTWLSDITYIDTAEGWLYLAGIEDVFSRKIVGWAMSDRLETGLVEDALEMAVTHRQPAAGLLHHSDRGSQYASHAYRAQLLKHQMRASMSRTANCYDNAMMESFWATLKTECVQQPFATRVQARTALFEYIEVFYNRQRLHSSLGYRSPDQFEALHSTLC